MRDRGGKGGVHQVGGGNLQRQDGLLQGRDIRCVNQRIVSQRDGVLPEQVVVVPLLGAEVAFTRPHVAVGQLVPGLGEGLGERVEVVEEFFTDLAVFGVDLQRNVGRHHHQGVQLAGDVRIGRFRRVRVGRGPLQRAGRALGLLPFVLEQVFEVVVVPLGRVRRPAPLDAVGHREFGIARALGVVPAKAHRLHRRNLGRGPDF